MFTYSNLNVQKSSPLAVLFHSPSSSPTLLVFSSATLPLQPLKRVINHPLKVSNIYVSHNTAVVGRRLSHLPRQELSIFIVVIVRVYVFQSSCYFFIRPKARVALSGCCDVVAFFQRDLLHRPSTQDN